MAGWSPCGEPVPVTRSLLGTVAGTSAPGKRQSRGFGEAAEAGDRTGGGEPVAAGDRRQQCRPPRRRGAVLPGRDRDGGRRMERCGRPRRGQGLLRCPAPANRRGAAGSVHGLGDFSPSQAVMQIHPTFRAAANVRGGTGRREGAQRQHPLSASPGLPSPGLAAALPAPGYGHALPSSVCWGRRGGGWRGQVYKNHGRKGKGKSLPGLQCLGHLLLLLYCCYPASQNNSQT